MLRRFLSVLGSFDWERYALALQGPLPLAELHNPRGEQAGRTKGESGFRSAGQEWSVGWLGYKGVQCRRRMLLKSCCMVRPRLWQAGVTRTPATGLQTIQ